MKINLFHIAIFIALFNFPPESINAQANFRGLMVLIDFSDQPGNITLNRINNIINGVGYTEPTVTSSLRDYWYTQSRGKVVVTHDVIGYFRAPQPASYYHTHDWTEFLVLARQALEWVVATNPNYNWNGLSLASGPMNRNGTEEGTFLSINFVSTANIPGTGGTHWLQGWTAPNGVSTQQITGSILVPWWTLTPNLFWITHEQGHMIWGWPDTYDYTNSSRGTGIYTVMSGNQQTGDIEPVGAPFLVAENWVNIIDITTQAITLAEDGNTVARFRKPTDPNEYFVIEARKRSTIGNAALPVYRGLLIWHVDNNVTTSNIYPQMTPTQHYRISVEQADGLFHLEGNSNSGDAGDIYLPGKTFNDQVTPNAKWWNESPSSLNINNIQLLSNNRISFNAASHFCLVGNSGKINMNVCHNGQTICLHQNAVAAHLGHGDYLGHCLPVTSNRDPLIAEELRQPGFNLSPNPNNGNFVATLDFPDEEIKNAVIRIINITGQVIKQLKVNQQHQVTINLRETGIYIVQLMTQNKVYEKKIITIR